MLPSACKWRRSGAPRIERTDESNRQWPLTHCDCDGGRCTGDAWRGTQPLALRALPNVPNERNASAALGWTVGAGRYGQDGPKAKLKAYSRGPSRPATEPFGLCCALPSMRPAGRRAPISVAAAVSVAAQRTESLSGCADSETAAIRFQVRLARAGRGGDVLGHRSEMQRNATQRKEYSH